MLHFIIILLCVFQTTINAMEELPKISLGKPPKKYLTVSDEPKHEKEKKSPRKKFTSTDEQHDQEKKSPRQNFVKRKSQSAVTTVKTKSTNDIADNNANQINPLLKAIQGDNLNELTAILNFNINSEDENKNTLLNIAVRKNNENQIKTLLKQRDIAVNRPNSWGNTPLHNAVLLNFINIIYILLLDPRVDTTKKNAEDKFPHALQVVQNTEESSTLKKNLFHRFTVDNVVNEETSQLRMSLKVNGAIINETIKTIQARINKDKNATQTELLPESELNFTSNEFIKNMTLNRYLNNKNTPLNEAVETNNENMVTLLLKQKDSASGVNKPNELGNTPFHNAVLLNFTNIIHILLKAPNVDTTKKNKNNKLAHEYLPNTKESSALKESLLARFILDNIVNEETFALQMSLKTNTITESTLDNIVIEETKPPEMLLKTNTITENDINETLKEIKKRITTDDKMQSLSQDAFNYVSDQFIKDMILNRYLPTLTTTQSMPTLTTTRAEDELMSNVIKQHISTLLATSSEKNVILDMLLSQHSNASASEALEIKLIENNK